MLQATPVQPSLHTQPEVELQIPLLPQLQGTWQRMPATFDAQSGQKKKRKKNVSVIIHFQSKAYHFIEYRMN